MLKTKSVRWFQTVRRFRNEEDSRGATTILIVCVLIGLLWYFLIRRDTVQYDLWVEFVGLIFDILVVLVVFSFYQFLRHEKSHIAEQHNTIEDYKGWDNEEANFQLAGAVRRLNRLGVTIIDLTGAKISNFSFPKNGISSLKGTTIYDGEWGKTIGDSSVEMTSVTFDHVDCRSVTFSAGDPFAGLVPTMRRFAVFADCTFLDTDLRNARFNGASLEWTKPPPKSHYYTEEDPETGQVVPVYESYGPFYDADLSGVSFSNCVFKNADFRDAKNIEDADFSGATGLERANFDTTEIREAVLKSAGQKSR